MDGRSRARVGDFLVFSPFDMGFWSFVHVVCVVLLLLDMTMTRRRKTLIVVSLSL